MQWVKATERTPEPYKWIPAKTWGGWSLVSYQKELDHFFDYRDNVISKEDVEWLDTEEPSFSIKDLILVWDKSQEITIENVSYDVNAESIEPDYSYMEKDRNTFFKKQFGIDITK